MYPCLAANNPANGGSMDPKPVCKISRRLRGGPDIDNLGEGECGSRVPFTVSASLFVHHVLHIVIRGSLPEVERIAAPPVVASVEGEIIVSDGPMLHNVGESVGLEGPDLPIYPRRKSSITITSNRRLPLPAFIGIAHINLRPESISNLLRNFISGKLSGLHELASLSGWGLSRTGDVSALPGLCLQDYTSHAQ